MTNWGCTKMNSSSMTVAVLGPGGVGGLVGALLAQAGHRVLCLATPQSVDVLRRDGIHVHSATFGDFTASVEADTCLREPVDLCIVAVKQTNLAGALNRIPSELVTNGVVVPLLNGVEHVGTLRRRFLPSSVAAGVIRVESTRTAPGHIVHGSPFVAIDVASSTAPHTRLAAAAAVLQESGITTNVLDDEGAMLWGKLSLLAPFALLTTRYSAPIGEIRSAYRDDLIQLVTEVAAVGIANGGSDVTTRALDFYDSFPFEARSSMERDAAAGLALELDAIGGAVIRGAELHDIPVPITRRLVTSLT